MGCTCRPGTECLCCSSSPFMKDEKITKTSYIANSGGLLGLCMGFSLVSAAEILYHCLFGLISPLCRSSRGRQPPAKDRLYQVYVYDKDVECGNGNGNGRGDEERGGGSAHAQQLPP